MRMDANLRDLFLYEVFLYYNPLLLVVSWGLILPYMLYIEHNFYGTLLDGFCCYFIVIQTMMVWLWGVNLWVFLQSTVSYAKVFDLDQNHLSHKEIWKVVRFFALPSFLRKHYSIQSGKLFDFFFFLILDFENQYFNHGFACIWCFENIGNQSNKCLGTQKQIMPLYGS